MAGPRSRRGPLSIQLRASQFTVSTILQVNLIRPPQVQYGHPVIHFDPKDAPRVQQHPLCLAPPNSPLEPGMRLSTSIPHYSPIQNISERYEKITQPSESTIPSQKKREKCPQENTGGLTKIHKTDMSWEDCTLLVGALRRALMYSPPSL